METGPKQPESSNISGTNVLKYELLLVNNFLRGYYL